MDPNKSDIIMMLWGRYWQKPPKWTISVKFGCGQQIVPIVAKQLVFFNKDLCITQTSKVSKLPPCFCCTSVLIREGFTPMVSRNNDVIRTSSLYSWRKVDIFENEIIDYVSFNELAKNTFLAFVIISLLTCSYHWRQI